MKELTREQYALILKYASDINACAAITCAECVLHKKATPSTCMFMPLSNVLISVSGTICSAIHEACRQYLKEHSDQYTPEEVTETLL